MAEERLFGDSTGTGVAEVEVHADNPPSLRVLLADPDEEAMEVCRVILEGEAHTCDVATDPAEIRRKLDRGRYDFVLLYERIPGLDVSSVLRDSSADRGGPLVTLLVDHPSLDVCRRWVRTGAWDCLPKPFSSGHLLALLGRAAFTVESTRRALASDEEGVLLSNGLTILGVSPQIRSALEMALRVAPTDAPVFVTGESGTGKELFARLIHEHSRRSRSAFMPLNCAALPGELLESEMFGHRRGAFTGAVRDKPGILETADRGTVFLDELAEMPVSLQAKLLRVVQDGTLRRVGSETIDGTVDVRIISAMNRSPQEALSAGRLREDLLYRLGVVNIELAPLRERPDDIPVLVHHLVPRLWKRYRPSSGRPPAFGQDAMEELLMRQWPGNVRELENVVGNAVIFADPGGEIRADDLPAHGGGAAMGNGGNGAGAAHAFADGAAAWMVDAQDPYHEAKERMLSRFERAFISRLLVRTEGNLCEAARKAQINRTTLYRLMEKHGLDRETLRRSVDGNGGPG